MATNEVTTPSVKEENVTEVDSNVPGEIPDYSRRDSVRNLVQHFSKMSDPPKQTTSLSAKHPLAKSIAPSPTHDVTPLPSHSKQRSRTIAEDKLPRGRTKSEPSTPPIEGSPGKTKSDENLTKREKKEKRKQSRSLYATATEPVRPAAEDLQALKKSFTTDSLPDGDEPISGKIKKRRSKDDTNIPDKTISESSKTSADDEVFNKYKTITLTAELSNNPKQIICAFWNRLKVREVHKIICRAIAPLVGSPENFRYDDFYLTCKLDNVPITLDPKKRLSEYSLKDQDIVTIILKKEMKLETVETPPTTPRKMSNVDDDEYKRRLKRASILSQFRQTVDAIPNYLGSSPGKGPNFSPSPSKRDKKKISPSTSIASSMTIVDSILEGYLMKKNKRHRYKKRWVVLDSQFLHCFKSQQDLNNPIKIPLMCSSVKVIPSDSRKFEIITPDTHYEFTAETEKEFLQWTALIEDACQNLINDSIEVKPKVEETEMTPEKKELVELMKLPGNSVCADCDSPKPEWASVNLGVFVCIQCSGAHRNMGTHISKVRSIMLDDWEPEFVEYMRNTGNEKANMYWEFSIPKTIKKPTSKSGLDERQKFIHAKYNLKEFVQKASDQNLVFLCWEDESKWFGFVESLTSVTLHAFRNVIVEQGIEIVGSFSFLFRKAPVTGVQENKKTVFECIVQVENNPTLLLRRMNSVTINN